MKLIHIKWIDSCGGDSGWYAIEDQDTDAMDTVVTCESVGWVLCDGKKSVTITHNIAHKNEALGADAQACMAMTIPRSAIIKITTIIGF